MVSQHRYRASRCEHRAGRRAIEDSERVVDGKTSQTDSSTLRTIDNTIRNVEYSVHRAPVVPVERKPARAAASPENASFDLQSLYIDKRDNLNPRYTFENASSSGRSISSRTPRQRLSLIIRGLHTIRFSSIGRQGTAKRTLSRRSGIISRKSTRVKRCFTSRAKSSPLITLIPCARGTQIISRINTVNTTFLSWTTCSSSRTRRKRRKSCSPI